MSFYLQQHPGLRTHAEFNISYQRFDLWFAQGNINGHKLLDVEMTVREDTDAGSPTPPTMSLSMAEAQALFDSLWATGLRPRDWGTKPTDVAGVKDEVIAAQKEHISDLREVIRRE